jgi:hypothetical protein
MATFYFDENMSLKVAPFLTGVGHRVVTYLDMRLKGARDDVQLFTAREQGWILATYNGNDFVLLHDALRRWSVAHLHGGILILPDNLTNRQQAQELDAFVAAALPVRNELYAWRENGGWVRRPFPPR